MEYAMITVLIPKEYEETFRADARHTMQDAANALQWNLYRGLCENLKQDVTLFNLLPCGSYPQYYRRPFVKGFAFDKAGHNLPFCNVKLLRNRFKTNALYKALDKWCRRSDEPKTLFLYTISQPLVAAVDKLKKKHPHVKVCAIVADLPDMANLSSKKSWLLKRFAANSAKNAYSMLDSIDAFVLLTRHMADYMHLTQPFCVMEGIAAVEADSAPLTAPERPMILYSGTLHRKFGVLHLLEAFRTIDDPSVTLCICGIGDSEEIIKEAAKEDPRIDFRGQLRRDEVLALQKQATVLVNPRLNNEEFTKYSFPSKTMEYLASGVPVVAYKLDGIPDEYDPYILYPEDDSVQAFAKALYSVCRLSQEEWCRRGERGKRFVAEHKNPVAQCRKIAELVKGDTSDK